MLLQSRKRIILSLGFAVIFSSCTPGADKAGTTGRTDDSFTVVSSNYPLYYFSTRIVGDLADVHFPVERTQDPADWTPAAADITAMQNADLVVLNGAGYESWIDKVTLNRRALLETAVSFESRWIDMEASFTHTHGPETKHAHGSVAYTTWLDFELAQLQAENIYTALADELPAHEAELRENYRLLVEDLQKLDAAMNKVGDHLNGQPLLTSHPVYQYLARAYDLNIESVHWEPGQAITTAQWLEFQKVHQRHPATVMLWEKEPLSDTRSRLTAMNIQVIVFNPLGSLPETGDFLAAMRDNVNLLRSL